VSTSAAWRSPTVRDQAKGRRVAGNSNLKSEAPHGTDSSQTPRPGLFRERVRRQKVEGVGLEPLFDCGGPDGWIRIPPGKELRANHEVRSRRDRRASFSR